jgi:hypothetical protein
MAAKFKINQPDSLPNLNKVKSMKINYIESSNQMQEYSIEMSK